MEKKNCCNENLELSESKDFLDFAVLKENLNILSSDNIMSDWILIFAILVAKSQYERDEEQELLKMKAKIRSDVNEQLDVTENLEIPE